MIVWGYCFFLYSIYYLSFYCLLGYFVEEIVKKGSLVNYLLWDFVKFRLCDKYVFLNWMKGFYFKWNEIIILKLNERIDKYKCF